MNYLGVYLKFQVWVRPNYSPQKSINPFHYLSKTTLTRLQLYTLIVVGVKKKKGRIHLARSR